MFYKNWPYWLKGGIIGLIAGRIFSWIQILFWIPFVGKILMIIIKLPVLILSAILSMFVEIPSFPLGLALIFLPVQFLYDFAIGALIGTIYGKRKNKSK